VSPTLQIMVEKNQNSDFKDLREKAERELRQEKITQDAVSKDAADKTLHELRVHQVELQMQNEQLRQAQAELEKSRQIYSDLFDFAPVGYFVLDIKGNIAEVNLTGTSMIGTERNVLVGKPFALFVGGEDKDAFYLCRKQVLRSGVRERCDLKIVRRDGVGFFAELLIDPVLDTEGEVTNCRIALIDITERKKAEELRQYQVKARAMASSDRRLREHEKAALAVELHEDVGQKLYSVKLNVETVLGSLADDKQKSSLKAAAQMVRQIILQLRTLTLGLRDPVLWEFGFVAAVENYLTEEIRDKHGLDVGLDTDEQLPDLRDEVEVCLFRVTRELLDNVIKHARATNVWVSIGTKHGRIRVIVKDDGVGFEPGQVKAKAAEAGQFGLFAVREQLESLGGQFTIESKPGRGTKATVVV